MDIVLGNAELLEVAPHGFCWNPRFPQRADRRSRGALRELLAVLAEDQAVVDELGRLRAERLEQPAVERLVRPVVVAAEHVSDPEVDVIYDAGQVVGRRPVLAQQRDAVEALAEPLCRLDVPRAALALTHRPLVPREPEPLEVAQQILLPARHVAGRVGVVDPEQQPVAERAVGDGAERVAHVQRAGRARGEPDARHEPRSAPSHSASGGSASSTRDVSPHAPSSSSFPVFRSRRGSTRPTTWSPTRSGKT